MTTCPTRTVPVPTAPTGAAVPGSIRWALWGSYAFLGVGDEHVLGAARRTAEQVLAEVDRACSRFRPDSCLVRANARPGRWTPVEPLLVAACRVAVAAAELTDGLVDPCLGRPLVSLGYDADLTAVRSRPPAPLPVQPPRPGAWREIELDDDAVRVPAGVALDLGATAKAWAADLVATTLAETTGGTVAVSLGGDLRVAVAEGSSLDGWPVQVAEHPRDVPHGPMVTVRGGLATSSTVVRRWRTTAGEQHHLLDPRTGAPVPEVYRTATAAGRTCVAANAATTAALVLGSDAPGWLAARDVTARLVAAEGAVVTVGDWPDDDRHTKETR